MNYQKIDPIPILKSWVKCFYHWSGRIEQELLIQSPPNAFAGLIYNFGNSYSALQGGVHQPPVPQNFVCGLFTSNYQLSLQGRIDMTGVVLYPTSVHNFMDIRMSSLVNNRMDLSLIQESSWLNLRSVLDGAGREKRIPIIQEFLIEHLATAQKRLSVIDDAFHYMDENKGLVEVGKTAEKFGISKRYLEKQFLIKVGVSPKFYARIKRFASASIPLAYQSTMDWQSMVEQYGFHDQSHLIKEFIEFNKMSPTEYIQKHHELSRLVKIQRPSS